ncbi:hypothetical protein [Streptomyces sp. NPDC101393]|uniref:hypothetical protein n=1 Tax=Streptomyces sp. NPDC101393 TaxID=3366141 RepID=UPI00380F6EAE
MVDARQERESAQAMEKQRKAREREERLSSFKGQHLTPTSPSDFHHHGINELRAMIENANPEAIETSGTHWRSSADLLAGEDGRGGIRKAFTDAVDHASAHWEGSAAEGFRKEAGRVLEKLDRTYQHSRNVESTLIGTREAGPDSGVAHSLREAKKAMSKIHDPGKLDSALDDKGDDAQFHKDMADPKMDARMALELNRDSLSLSKERQVEAVIVMDELANNYGRNGGILREGTGPGVTGDWPVPPSRSQRPRPVNMPDTGGSRPDPSSVQTHTPNGAGGHAVPAGFDGPKISSPDLPVNTGLDSVQGGTLAPTPGPTAIGGGPSGAAHHGVSGGSGGFPNGAIPPGVIGMPGGAKGAGGMRGGMAGAGRPGAGGAMGGGSGKAGAAGAAGRTGAQARTRGGQVGKPGGPAGGAKQGGAGLHRSRGGKNAGMAGAHGTKGKGEEKERNSGKRPDYLVEDEETWASKRNVAPRVIE